MGFIAKVVLLYPFYILLFEGVAQLMERCEQKTNDDIKSVIVRK